MSAAKETASSSTVTKPTKTEQTLFEEDDEFEEFPAEGTLTICVQMWCALFRTSTNVDWDEREEDSGDRQLWEDNWDDDNVEDDFSCQLRYDININFLIIDPLPNPPPPPQTHF